MSCAARNSAYTYYVCYNQITYLVASEHASRNAHGHSALLVDPLRVVRQVRFSGVAHRNLTRWQILLACFRCLTSSRVVVYLPHQKVGRLLRLLSRLASSTRLVDDGLDTLREKPRNIRVNALSGIEELLTFTDYRRLASWTHALVVTRVCPLSVLLEDERPAMPTGAYKTLVVQSPGVDMTKVSDLTGAMPGEAFVFVHGNPVKRSAIPSGFAFGTSPSVSIERSIAGFNGSVVSGETMVTLLALYCVPQSQLIIQLSIQQYDNLSCIHDELKASGARVLLHQD